MSKDNLAVSETTWSMYSFWLIVFVIIKLGGTALATWSWWWVLAPIIPDLVCLLKRAGVL